MQRTVTILTIILVRFARVHKLCRFWCGQIMVTMYRLSLIHI